MCREPTKTTPTPPNAERTPHGCSSASVQRNAPHCWHWTARVQRGRLRKIQVFADRLLVNTLPLHTAMVQHCGGPLPLPRTRGFSLSIMICMMKTSATLSAAHAAKSNKTGSVPRDCTSPLSLRSSIHSATELERRPFRRLCCCPMMSSSVTSLEVMVSGQQCKPR